MDDEEIKHGFARDVVQVAPTLIRAACEWQLIGAPL
jgi:hypothetical protein